MNCWSCGADDEDLVLKGDSIYCQECKIWNGYYDFSVDEENKKWNLEVRWEKDRGGNPIVEHIVKDITRVEPFYGNLEDYK